MAAYTWGRSWPTSGTARAHPSAVEAALPGIVIAVSAGYEHTAVLSGFNLYTSGSSLDGQLGRSGDPKLLLPCPMLGDVTPVSVACGAYSTHILTSEQTLFECGALFQAHEAALPGENADGGQVLPGLAERLNRNEYLRRIVLRSEAAYLAATDVSNVTGLGGGRAGAHVRAEDGQEAEGTGQGRGSIPGSASTPTVDISVLKMRVRRVRVDRFRPARGLDMVKVAGVAAGYAHVIAWDIAGRLYACGYNDRGQLGSGNRIGSADFIPVPLPPEIFVVTVAIGQQHSIALTVHGAVLSWGSNALGQLGLGNSMDRLTPTHIPRTGPRDDNFVLNPMRANPMRDDNIVHGDMESETVIVGAACGAVHTVLLTEMGECLFFGHSEYGQAGPMFAGADLLHTSRHYYTPRRVKGLGKRVVALSAGAQFTLAVAEDGSVCSWGWDAHFCLGHGLDLRGTSGDVAEVTGLGNAVAVACGYHHAVAVCRVEGYPFTAPWGALFRAANLDAEDERAAADGIASGGSVRGTTGAHLARPTVRSRAIFMTSMTDFLDVDADDASIPAWRRSGGENVSAVDVGTASAFANRRGAVVDNAIGGDSQAGDVSEAQATLAAAPPDVQLLIDEQAAAPARAAPSGPYLSLVSTPAQPMAGLPALWAEMKTAAETRQGRVHDAQHAQHQDASRLHTRGNHSGPAIVPAVERPLYAHALILSARCPALGAALKSAARTAVQSAVEGVGHGQVQLSLGEGSPPAVVACTWNADTGLQAWTVRFPAVLRRAALSAFVQYCYVDALPPGKHIPQAFIRIIQPDALDMPRLVRLAAKAHQTGHQSGGVLSTGGPLVGRYRPLPAFPISPPGGGGRTGVGDSTFLADMLVAKQNFEMADVDVVVVPQSGGLAVTFHCHRLVLCRFEYFRKLLHGPWRPTGIGVDGPTRPSQQSIRTLTLAETDPADFAPLLRFLYTGDVFPLAGIECEGEGGLDPEAALKVLALGARLCVDDFVARGQYAVAGRLKEGGADEASVRACVDYAEAFGLMRLQRMATAMLISK